MSGGRARGEGARTRCASRRSSLPPWDRSWRSAAPDVLVAARLPLEVFVAAPRARYSSDNVEIPRPFVRLLGLALALVACGGSPAGDAGGAPDATAEGAPDDVPDGSPASPDGAPTPVTGGGGVLPPSQGQVPDGGGCGYREAGVPLHVANGLDLCMPPVACTSEVCPPELGDCVNDRCVFHAGYQGVATLPEAWVTYYCELEGGGCHGVTQIEFPEITAQKVATARGLPLCAEASGGTSECVGIAAAPAMIVGNSQEAVDSTTKQTVADWGLGLTEASGLCYELTGPGGTVLVALTDRCGGYCECKGSSFEECGPCVNAPDMKLQCPCVGTVPPLYTSCCGNGCGTTTNPQCDWCASNNHPHFDLDTASFNRICGSLSTQGSCKLASVRYVPCLDVPGWPPGGGGGGSCQGGSFQCATTLPHQEQLPGTSCCCSWNACPSGAACAAAPSSCKAGSCACGAGEPDSTHPQVPGSACCCLAGLAPQADGTCN
jgi:hypothetical protein